MKWYLCKECNNISENRQDCPSCGDEMEKVKISRGLEGSIPFILAGLAASLLLVSFIIDRYTLIWFAFPLIGAGLIYDHLYEKQMKKILKNKIKKEK